MDITRTAFGSWNGGRFMSYGRPLSDDEWIDLVRKAHESGIRTFMTADVYGNGEADSLLGRALSGLPRNSYSLVGLIGHDFYDGRRDGAKGFPRFSDPRLRAPGEFASYLRMATEKSLERCGADRFDLVMLHNPDSVGYTSDRVWTSMEKLREAKLTNRLGVAPGPANGFTLDLLLCLERFGPLLDWAMIILNPLEPWPGSMVLPAAEQSDVKVMTRVVDYGGVFHGDVKPGHAFGQGDHRAFRPAGWVEAANAKLDRLRPIAEHHGLTPLQFACLWCLQQPAVQSVVPTLIQEIGPSARPIELKLEELAKLPYENFNEEELEMIRRIGDNAGCMQLKGGNANHTTAPTPDQWSLTPELEDVARRWHIEPARDLAFTHANK